MRWFDDYTDDVLLDDCISLGHNCWTATMMINVIDRENRICLTRNLTSIIGEDPISCQ